MTAASRSALASSWRRPALASRGRDRSRRAARNRLGVRHSLRAASGRLRVRAPLGQRGLVVGDLRLRLVLPLNCFRLEAGDLRLELWYSEDKEWLALESEVAGGRTLRYEPIRGDA